MTYQILKTDLPEILLLKPRAFADERGFFMETWSEMAFKEATGLDIHFIQDNQSVSRAGTVRGLHFQRPPHGQGKLVRCSRGAVFDVALDIRRGSTTFGKWAGAILSEKNQLEAWIPAGFAHGFLALEDQSTVIYKVDAPWVPAAEAGIRWNDPTLGIDWPEIPGIEPPLSEKDRQAPLFQDAIPFLPLYEENPA